MFGTQQQIKLISLPRYGPRTDARSVLLFSIVLRTQLKMVNL